MVDNVLCRPSNLHPFRSVLGGECLLGLSCKGDVCSQCTNAKRYLDRNWEGNRDNIHAKYADQLIGRRKGTLIMDIMERIRSLFTRHTELGRQHEELGKSLDDLKREAHQVQETIDKAVYDFQRFATKVKKSRSSIPTSRTTQVKAKRVK